MTHCTGGKSPEVGLFIPINLTNTQKTPNVNTVKPSEGKSAKVESEVIKSWYACMYAEERTSLIGELVALGIGTNDGKL
jgi:hypothetical protein